MRLDAASCIEGGEGESEPRMKTISLFLLRSTNASRKINPFGESYVFPDLIMDARVLY